MLFVINHLSLGVGTIVFHCYKYGLLKRIIHVFGYFSSTLQKYIKCIIYLALIVEVNSSKIKWIMGVCDLNY